MRVALRATATNSIFVLFVSFVVENSLHNRTEWQKKIEELYKSADVADFLRLIDFDKLTRNLELADNGARSLSVKFPKVEGIPENISWGRQIFALKKGCSVVPHGHNNMATAFLILKGEFRGRHFAST